MPSEILGSVQVENLRSCSFQRKLGCGSHGIIVQLKHNDGQFTMMHVCSSVQFSRSIVSDSLRPHELQHARPPCPSPTPRVYSNSCALSWWCHPTISSCHAPLLPSVSPSIRSFSSQSALCIRWSKYWTPSASTSVLPMNTQDWSPLGWTDWISLQSKGLSRVFSNTTVQKHQFFSAQPSL